MTAQPARDFTAHVIIIVRRHCVLGRHPWAASVEQVFIAIGHTWCLLTWCILSLDRIKLCKRPVPDQNLRWHKCSTHAKPLTYISPSCRSSNCWVIICMKVACRCARRNQHQLCCCFAQPQQHRSAKCCKLKCKCSILVVLVLVVAQEGVNSRVMYCRCAHPGR